MGLKPDVDTRPCLWTRNCCVPLHLVTLPFPHFPTSAALRIKLSMLGELQEGGSSDSFSFVVYNCPGYNSAQLVEGVGVLDARVAEGTEDWRKLCYMSKETGIKPVLKRPRS